MSLTAQQEINIIDNPKMSCEDLAVFLNVSCRSVHRFRAQQKQIEAEELKCSEEDLRQQYLNSAFENLKFGE